MPIWYAVHGAKPGSILVVGIASTPFDKRLARNNSALRATIRLRLMQTDAGWVPTGWPGPTDDEEPEAVPPPATPAPATAKSSYRGANSLPVVIRIPAHMDLRALPVSAAPVAADSVDDGEIRGPTRRIFCPEEYRTQFLSMTDVHAAAHPDTFAYSRSSPEGIREYAVRQMYTFCHANDLREVWASIWEIWYRPRAGSSRRFRCSARCLA